MTRHLFREILNVDTEFPRMPYSEAIEKYGSDKPDIRFGMTLNDITELAQGKEFVVFNSAESVIAICVENCADYTRKQLDELTEFVKRQQIGAKGMVYVKYNSDGTLKSSVDKFYTESDLKSWAEACNAKPGDLLLICRENAVKRRYRWALYVSKWATVWD